MCRKLTYLVSFVLVLVLVSNVSAGLVAHWEFDDGSGIAAVDSSGNGHDGTLQGDPQWVAGMIGSGALSFDGSDGLVDVGHDESLSITDELTITVWVKVGDLSTYYFLVCKQPSGTAGDNYPGNYEFRTEANTGALQFGHQEAEGEQYTFYNSETSITAEQWYHVAVSVTKGELVEFYINGVSAGSAEQLTNFGVLNDEPVRIGGRKDGYSFFNGILDDVRLYDRALSAVQIQKLYNGNPPMFTIAEKPDPADGALLEDTWVNLSWRAGDSAVSHDVYLGEDFDDVEAGTGGTFQGNQASTNLIIGFPGFAYPDGLVPGTTYYWRIDEVNDADPNSPWKGDVWSFWIPPYTAYDPDPADGVKFVPPDVELNWTAGFRAKLHYVYFGDNFDDVNNATEGVAQGITTYTPGPLKLAGTYYWRVDEFDGIDTYKGNVWSFTTEGAVGNPNPSNGAVDVERTPILSWSPGVYADSHQVYFGTDEDAVCNADTTSPEYKATKALGSESYDPGKLQWYTTYYWRIDEVNDVNPDSPWTGNVWNFKTADFLVVDDFEDYNDYEPIFDTWKDGWEIPENGSLVGCDYPIYPSWRWCFEIAHGGEQSMPFFYDNSGTALYSEATRTFSPAQDWTEESVGVLSLWFYGDANNAHEPMYVALNGGAAVYYDNPDALLIEDWTQWRIDLQEFAGQGVNLANVNTITIGFGEKNNLQAGGSGMVLFDDIRLYRPAPEPEPAP